MNKALRVPDYLRHILKAIDRIDRYTEGLDEVAFLKSDLVQDAVIRNIEIIGEASNSIVRVSPEFAAQHDDIPWLVMYAMRNRVSHGYDKVDLEILWKTIQADLPSLSNKITELSKEVHRNLDQAGFE
jgi:uncharacterized protein with HEPN domain